VFRKRNAPEVTSSLLPVTPRLSLQTSNSGSNLALRHDATAANGSGAGLSGLSGSGSGGSLSALASASTSASAALKYSIGGSSPTNVSAGSNSNKNNAANATSATAASAAAASSFVDRRSGIVIFGTQCITSLEDANRIRSERGAEARVTDPALIRIFAQLYRVPYTVDDPQEEICANTDDNGEGLSTEQQEAKLDGLRSRGRSENYDQDFLTLTGAAFEGEGGNVGSVTAGSTSAANGGAGASSGVLCGMAGAGGGGGGGGAGGAGAESHGADRKAEDMRRWQLSANRIHELALKSCRANLAVATAAGLHCRVAVWTSLLSMMPFPLPPEVLTAEEAQPLEEEVVLVGGIGAVLPLLAGEASDSHLDTLGGEGASSFGSPQRQDSTAGAQGGEGGGGGGSVSGTPNASQKLRSQKNGAAGLALGHKAEKSSGASSSSSRGALRTKVRARNPFPELPFTLELIGQLLRELLEGGDVQHFVVAAEVLRSANVLSAVCAAAGISELRLQRGYLIYLDLLTKLALFCEANDLIKASTDKYISTLNQLGVQVGLKCSTCNKELSATSTGWCERCSRSVSVCVLCHKPVKGLMHWCALCAHGGHLECTRKWFSQSDECPAGCGHGCCTEMLRTACSAADANAAAAAAANRGNAAGVAPSDIGGSRDQGPGPGPAEEHMKSNGVGIGGAHSSSARAHSNGAVLCKEKCKRFEWLRSLDYCMNVPQSGSGSGAVRSRSSSRASVTPKVPPPPLAAALYLSPGTGTIVGAGTTGASAGTSAASATNLTPLSFTHPNGVAFSERSVQRHILRRRKLQVLVAMS
jgi:hypothetical protein